MDNLARIKNERATFALQVAIMALKEFNEMNVGVAAPTGMAQKIAEAALTQIK